MALRFRDLKGKNIYINKNIERRGKRSLDTPKNQSSVRKFKISIFERYRIYRLRNYYIKKYSDCSEDYYIFGGIKPISTTTADRYKEKACTKAKLHVITQHEFRHSYATRTIGKGKPINKVSKIMGHSSPSITLDVYTH